MKRSNQNPTGTSFHGNIIIATPNQLIELFGKPEYGQNDGCDKVNMEWICENSDGEIVTIYDWKEYRPLQMDQSYEWHLGSHNPYSTLKAQRELSKAISALKNRDMYI